MAIRRHPDAIIMAHKMDPTRRELYVEGARDRLFLAWVFSDLIDRNTSIQQIAFVEMVDSIEGGERGRLIAFARRIEGESDTRRTWLSDTTERLAWS